MTPCLPVLSPVNVSGCLGSSQHPPRQQGDQDGHQTQQQLPHLPRPLLLRPPSLVALLRVVLQTIKGAVLMNTNMREHGLSVLGEKKGRAMGRVTFVCERFSGIETQSHPPFSEWNTRQSWGRLS